jgi:hypothetical protein
MFGGGGSYSPTVAGSSSASKKNNTSTPSPYLQYGLGTPSDVTYGSSSSYVAPVISGSNMLFGTGIPGDPGNGVSGTSGTTGSGTGTAKIVVKPPAPVDPSVDVTKLDQDIQNLIATKAASIGMSYAEMANMVQFDLNLMYLSGEDVAGSLYSRVEGICDAIIQNKTSEYSTNNDFTNSTLNATNYQNQQYSYTYETNYEHVGALIGFAVGGVAAALIFSATGNLGLASGTWMLATGAGDYIQYGSDSDKIWMMQIGAGLVVASSAPQALGAIMGVSPAALSGGAVGLAVTGIQGVGVGGITWGGLNALFGKEEIEKAVGEENYEVIDMTINSTLSFFTLAAYLGQYLYNNGNNNNVTTDTKESSASNQSTNSKTLTYDNIDFDTYQELRKEAEALKSNGITDIEIHHILEQRFGKMDPDLITCVALTHAEHVQFTQAWRDAFAYGQTNYGALTPLQIYEKGKDVYADYPDLLKALYDMLFP